MGHPISCRIQRNDRPHPRSRSIVKQGIRQSITGVMLVVMAIAVSVPALSQSPSPPAISAPKPVSSPIATTQPITRSATQLPTQPLRIATRLIKPDAFEENGQIVGFSIDLGQSILKQLQREAVLKTYASTTEVLNAVQSGQADLGLGAIAITREREQRFDFSHPVLSTGLQIMVPAPSEQSNRVENGILRRIFDPSLLRLFGVIAVLMLIPVHILWYSERNNKDSMIENSSYIPGIFQAMWWSLLALVGQADDMPQGPVGRIVALFWMFIGIIFVTYFTAIITAELTVQEIQGNIHELSDLPDHRVALVSDSGGLEYLQERNIQQVTEFPKIEQAYDALVADQVDAIVAPGPLLRYFAAQTGKGKVQTVGTPFNEQFYSIVMPRDSAYRRPVNQAILTLKEDGTYRKIYQKWFGANPQE